MNLEVTAVTESIVRIRYYGKMWIDLAVPRSELLKGPAKKIRFFKKADVDWGFAEALRGTYASRNTNSSP